MRLMQEHGDYFFDDEYNQRWQLVPTGDPQMPVQIILVDRSVDREVTDEGLIFSVTYTSRSGDEAHHQTTDRRALLEWVDAHYRHDAAITLTTQARGAAAVNMLAAIRYGLARHLAPFLARRDEGADEK